MVCSADFSIEMTRALECACRVVLSCVAPRSPNTPLNNKLTSVLVYVWSGRSRRRACDVKMAAQIRRYPHQSGTINTCKDSEFDDLSDPLSVWLVEKDEREPIW